VDAKYGPLEVLLGGGLTGTVQRLAGTRRVVDEVRPLVAVIVRANPLPNQLLANAVVTQHFYLLIEET
jgi:hypothetical protein